MSKNIFVFTILNLIISFTYSQTSVKDSLENLLLNYKKEDTIRVNLLTQTAYEQNHIDTLLIYSKKAEKLSKKLNFIKGEAVSYRLIGAYYQFTDNFPKAIEYFEKSKKLSKEIKNSKILADCLLSIAIIYLYQSNNYKSLDYHYQVLKIAEKNKYNLIISGCYNNIGMIYQELNEYSKSREFYEKSIKINNKIGDEMSTGTTLNNIGTIYFDEANYEQALIYYNRALKVNEKYKNMYDIASCLLNIGSVYYRLEKNVEALDFFQKSLEYGNKRINSSVYYYIGAIKLKQKKTLKALEYALISLKISKELELIIEQRDSYKLLAIIYKNRNNYKKAYENQLLYEKLKDSIFNEKNIRDITNLENHYKFDKEKQAIKVKQQKKDAVNKEYEKQQKIIRNLFIGAFILTLFLFFIIFRSFIQKSKANNILKQQKEKIKLQSEILTEKNKQLEELSNFKEGLTGMIIHDLKNPISTIISISKNKEITSICWHLLNMVSNILDVQRYEDSKMKLILKSYSLYKLSNNALQQVKLLAEQKRIVPQNNIPLNRFIEADDEIIYRIFINLLTNAIKYTPENGKIIINCEEDSKNSNFTRISITDNGIGIEEDKLKSIFDKFTQIIAKKSGKARATGIGLTFCKIAIEAHGGEINVTSIPNKETIFSFTIPIAKENVKNENIIIIEERTKKIELNKKEKKYLEHFIIRYKKYDIFDIMPLRKITAEIDDNFSENIKNWKAKMQQIVYNTNETEFKELLMNC